MRGRSLTDWSPKTPAWTTGAAPKVLEPLTVRGTHSLQEFAALHSNGSTEPGRLQPTSSIENEVVRGDAYHFGLCTLILRELLDRCAVSEAAVKQVVLEKLEMCRTTGRVLQVTLAEATKTKNKKDKSWALVTVDTVMCANILLDRFGGNEESDCRIGRLDIIRASKSHGRFKIFYEEAKRKAAAELNEILVEKRAKEAKLLRERDALGFGQQKGSRYSFGTCTLHVRNIPKMKSLRAKTFSEYENAVAKLFQERLEDHQGGKVVQVTIRHREYTTCRKTGKEIPALSWGLVTLNKEEAVATVQQCVKPPLSLY